MHKEILIITMAPPSGQHAQASSSGATTTLRHPGPGSTGTVKAKPSSLASALSGGMSGALISACVQPLDVIRTKMQAEAAKGIHRSGVSILGTILQERGLRGLWQGTGPSVLRVGLGAGLHFVLLEQFNTLLARRVEGSSTTLSAIGAAASGGLSRAVAAIVLCPITVVKTRMEYSGNAVSVPKYQNTFHALASIGRAEGVRGLFHGLVPTVMTNAPFSGLYYMFYTQLKRQLSSEDRPQTLVNFGSGVAAAVAASVLTQPTDVVRTRMQLGLAGSSSLSTLAHIFKQQGVSGLLTGVGPRILKRTAQTALVWTLYEELLPKLTAGIAWVKEAAVRQAEEQGEQGKLVKYVTPLQAEQSDAGNGKRKG